MSAAALKTYPSERRHPRDEGTRHTNVKPPQGNHTFDSLHTREEAEALIDKDFAQTMRSDEWTGYFVETMLQYLLWQKAPSGKICDADMAWLIGRVLVQPSPSMPTLLLALLREMNDPPTHLISLALRSLGLENAQDFPKFCASHPILTLPNPAAPYTA